MQSQIQPLRLRVPVNYPYNSPISLEETPYDTRYEIFLEINYNVGTKHI